MPLCRLQRTHCLNRLHTIQKSPAFCVPAAGTSVSPVEIARRGVEEGKARKVDVIIIDTAGRLQIDPEMMAVRVYWDTGYLKPF